MDMRKLSASIVGLLSTVAPLLGCDPDKGDGASTDNDDNDCPVGALDCSCTDGGGCDPGLTCVEDTCTDPTGGSGEDDSAGTDNGVCARYGRLHEVCYGDGEEDGDYGDYSYSAAEQCEQSIGYFEYVYGSDCAATVEDYYACLSELDCRALEVGEGCEAALDIVDTTCFAVDCPEWFLPEGDAAGYVYDGDEYDLLGAELVDGSFELGVASFTGIYGGPTEPGTYVIETKDSNPSDCGLCVWLHPTEGPSMLMMPAEGIGQVVIESMPDPWLPVPDGLFAGRLEGIRLQQLDYAYEPVDGGCVLEIDTLSWEVEFGARDVTMATRMRGKAGRSGRLRE